VWLIGYFIHQGFAGSGCCKSAIAVHRQGIRCHTQNFAFQIRLRQQVEGAHLQRFEPFPFGGGPGRENKLSVQSLRPDSIQKMLPDSRSLVKIADDQIEACKIEFWNLPVARGQKSVVRWPSSSRLCSKAVRDSSSSSKTIMDFTPVASPSAHAE
jgi:hypothetical protein